MKDVALILGAHGNFGAATAQALRAAGWEVRPYARGTDMAAAAQGARLIVNWLNPPGYHDWARLIPEITGNVLKAARASGATVLVPGNVYPYGREPGPWGPHTPHRPVARKGVIRAEMEARYRAAAEAGDARVILLRGGDFLMEGAASVVINSLILKSVTKGRITNLGRNPDALHTWAYLPDMARAAVGLVALGAALPAYGDIPFAGYALSMSDLARDVARLSGQAVRVKPFPVWIFTALSPVWELARELREMLYLFDHPHSLEGNTLGSLLPDFRPTPWDSVLTRHLRALGVAVQNPS